MATSKQSAPGIRATSGLVGTLLGNLRAGLAVGSAASALFAGVPLAQAAEANNAQVPAGAPALAQATPAGDPLVLPTVRVEGKADSYKTEKPSLDKVATPVVNTPQTVALVPKQVIEEQRATTVRDALRNVSGITVSAGEGGRQGDTFILRGFSGQTDVFRDGGRDLGWFTRDTFNLEGVEVYFGPSSVLFGRGSTGGAVNLVTKAPRRGTFAEAKLSGGSAPTGRLEGDVNHAFSDKVRTRLNVMGQRGRIAGRDVVEANRTGVAPSVRFVLGEHTFVGLDYLYQRERSTPDYGVPFVAGKPVSSGYGVPRTAFYGVEGADTENVDAHIATARFEHGFTPGTKLTSSFRFGRVDRLARPTAPRNLAPAANPTQLDRQRFQTETDNTSFISQSDVRVLGETGPLKHQANFGLELSHEKRRQWRHNFQLTSASGAASNITANLQSPDHAPSLANVDTVFQSYNRGVQLGGALYAADQIAIGPYVELLGSLRFDALDTNYRALNAQYAVSVFDKTDYIFSYRGGVVLHPVEKTSVYGTVATSANPSAEAGTLSNGTASLDPEKNIVYELGAKADLFDARLGLGGSLFRIDKTNARVPGLDPQSPLQILDGKQRVQGANIGGAGTLVETESVTWKVFASYTYLRSRIRRHSNEFLLGQALPNTPPHSASIWTTLSPVKDLSIGGGASFQSQTAVNNPANAMALLNKVPGFARLDAFAAYTLAAFELQVNVSNLTNALFYTQVSGNQAVPAEGRLLMVTGKYRL